MPAPLTLKELLDTLPQTGRLVSIGLRPKRREPILDVQQAELDSAGGLVGDRYAGSGGKRQVTLVQHEHVAAIASILGRDIDAHELRRNLVVAGINLLALKNRQFRIGSTILEGTGLCHPCSRMEEVFGPGGYNAVRGHGGITARVISGGPITVTDAVSLLLQTG